MQGISTITPPELLAALWRIKGRIAIFAFLALLIGGLYVFALATPRFTASASLVLETNSAQVVNVDSVLSGVSTDEVAINTEVGVLQSLDLLEQLVLDLGLLEDPEFNTTLVPPSLLSLDQLKLLIARYLPSFYSIRPLTDAEILELTTQNVQDAISVVPVRDTYIFDLRITTDSITKSAVIANRLAEIYIDAQVSAKLTATESAINWLSQRVQAMEVELIDKEAFLESLAEDSQFTSPAALEAMKARSIGLQERTRSIENSLEDRQVQSADIVSKLEIEDYAGLHDAYPQIGLRMLLPQLARQDNATRQAAKALVEDFLAANELEVQRLIAQKVALDGSLDTLLQDIRTQTRELAELARLQRELEASQVVYETFLARLKEASAQVGLQLADVRFLSRARPGRLVEPNRPLTLFIAVVLGGVLGALLGLPKQLQRNRFRTSTELSSMADLPVIGEIPDANIRRRTKLVEYIVGNPTSALSETVRNFRTSLMLSDIGHPPQVIMLTSSLPSEGKTTLSISLAHNFSGLNKKVLLIEGDVRRSTLNQYFSAQNAGNLMDAIEARCSLEEVVYRPPDIDIDVVFGSATDRNAADVLAGEGFAKFIADARAAYDYVIVDTPPVLLVSDPRLIAVHVDAIAYCVRWDFVLRDQVAAGLQQLAPVRNKIRGVVLTQIDGKRLSKYGYDKNYGAYSTYGNSYY